MNLPADDRTAQRADGADAATTESAGVDAASADAVAAETGDSDAVGAVADDAGVARAAAAQRTATRRILDDVFGDVLPTVTRDELDDGTDRSGGGRDQWYRDNRPPHHG